MTVDLATRYLGLELRSPIVASAAPQNADPTAPRSPRGRGRRRDRPSIAVRGGDRAEELELNRSLEQGTEHFAEALHYFPEVEASHRRGRPLPCGTRADQGPATVPDHRQPQRHHAPADGSLTRGLSQAAGADALELNLYYIAADPRRTAAEMEASDLEAHRGRARGGHDPARGQAEPLYSALANFAAMAAAAGRRRSRLFNRFYQPDIDLDSLDVVPRLELSHPGRCGCRCAGSRSCDRSSAPGSPSRPPPACRPGRRGQGSDGRRRRRDDDLGPAAPRPRACHDRGGGASGLDVEREYESVDQLAAARARPPSRSARVRTRQLHADASIVGDAGAPNSTIHGPEGGLDGLMQARSSRFPEQRGYRVGADALLRGQLETRGCRGPPASPQSDLADVLDQRPSSPPAAACPDVVDEHVGTFGQITRASCEDRGSDFRLARCI